jgi:hypothetical protein
MISTHTAEDEQKIYISGDDEFIINSKSQLVPHDMLSWRYLFLPELTIWLWYVKTFFYKKKVVVYIDVECERTNCKDE